MRKISGLLALSFLLCLLGGCNLLERSYAIEEEHSQFAADAEEQGRSILQAENYQSLVAALLHLVGRGEESATLRLHNYKGEAESELDRACLEVSEQDPLGAWAVSYIKYDLARPGDYYEASLKIVYQRSWQQISAVSSVTGSSALRGECKAALQEFQKEKVLRVSYFDQSLGPQELEALLRDAYYETPEAAFGLPSVQITLYPAQPQGSQRLVELLLGYSAPREELKEKQTALREHAQRLLLPLEDKTQAQQLEEILRLTERIPQSPAGEASAYAALLGTGANEEGRVLACELLLQTAGLQCRPLWGTHNGSARFWLLVRLESGWQHLDFSEARPALRGDTALRARGYAWQGEVPACPELGA